jgi:hypothetical protein
VKDFIEFITDLCFLAAAIVILLGIVYAPVVVLIVIYGGCR